MKIHLTTFILLFAFFYAKSLILTPSNNFATHKINGTVVAVFTVNKSIFSSVHDSARYKIVISGKVTKKEEIWDRRTNPLMGRPDFLKEIIFHIQTDSILNSDTIKVSGIITASVKDPKMLVKYKSIPEGEVGIFKLHGNHMPFTLVEFDSLPGITGKVANKTIGVNSGVKQHKNTNIDSPQEKDSLIIFERKGGKEMTNSKTLQKEAVQFIAKKYGLHNAEFVSLTSFSGPCPPDGGYIYWGVRGQIKGKWYIWQSTTNSKLNEGKDLIDPKRYQKCNAPTTKITTPSGTIPIIDLKQGDMVISGNNKPARVLEVSKVKADNHHVCQTVFDDGVIIEISPMHPLADGRLFGTLKKGDMVNGKRVVNNEMVPFKYEYTYDILPDSPSGTYFVCGIEIASTMK